jgi:hypothetical protein
LISVSVAPLSYFFCANATEPENNAAADTPPTKPRLLVFTHDLPSENGAGLSSENAMLKRQNDKRPPESGGPCSGFRDAVR